MSGRYCERISSLELSSFGGVGAYGSPLLGLEDEKNNPAILRETVMMRFQAECRYCSLNSCSCCNAKCKDLENLRRMPAEGE